MSEKIFLFHGGPLKTEYFGGHSFWTWKAGQAAEYMDGADDLWVIEMDKSAETIADEDDYLPDGGYGETDMQQNYDLQTATIKAAVDAGATVVLCDDGWVVVNVERLSPRKISLEEAEEMC